VFDLLCEGFDRTDSEAIYKRRNSWNNTINTALKAIEKDLGWNIGLTFHVARHTWAVLALANGASISEISRLLGHRSTGVTELVYAEFLPETLSSVVGKLGFDFLPDIEKR
jgi:integrase